MTRSAQHDAGDLLASAAAGDERSFRRIIATHHDDMRRVCMSVADEMPAAAEYRTPRLIKTSQPG